MNRLPLFLALRYLTGIRKEKSISTMAVISFIGIFIGTFALALIASIMNGFEKVTHEKMQSIHPQIIMHANGEELDYHKIRTVIEKEFDQIAHISPNAIKQVIATSDTDDEYTIVALKAVDPSTEPLVCSIEEKIIPIFGKKQTLVAATEQNKLLIGSKMAKSFDVKIGNTINLFSSHDDKIKKRKINLRQKEATIGGIFKTGIEEFDNNLIISSLDFFHTIFEDTGITQISIQLKPGTNEARVIEQLKNRLHLQVYSWKDLYPALLEALKLEKYAMFLILALIILVASMNIISLLFMQITQKRADIAILKAMGLSHANISSIFLYMGMAVSLIGSLFGLICAYIAGWILETYPLIKLPDAYYVTHLPAKMEPSIFIAVFIVVILLGFLSTWLPARKTKKINISHVLRFEG